MFSLVGSPLELGALKDARNPRILQWDKGGVKRLETSVVASTTIREPETMHPKVTTPMITPTLLRARSLGEPGAGIPHAGISEGAVGQPAVLP
jgi:hypothetical protein